jgi:hypothetical protein
MNKMDFLKSLEYPSIPDMGNVYLKSLWYDANGHWDKAHTSIQNLEDPTAQRIHAYLHRKEGDVWNAEYWYNKIGMSIPNISLDNEWNELVDTLF